MFYISNILFNSIEFYILPIIEYALFICYNKFFFSYIAFNQTKDTLVDFDVRFKKKNLSAKSFNGSYTIKENLAFFLLNLLSFFKISEFTTYLKIKNTRVQYFIKK